MDSPDWRVRLHRNGSTTGRSSRGAEAPSPPGLGERTFEQIILQGDLADLRVQRRHVDGRVGRLPAGGKDLHGAGEPLRAPLADLVGMELEALGESSARVASPLRAASATLALKAGE